MYVMAYCPRRPLILGHMLCVRAGGRRHDCRGAALALRLPQPVEAALSGAPSLPIGAYAAGSGWRLSLWKSGHVAQRPNEKPRHGQPPRPMLRILRLCVTGSCTSARLPSRAFKAEVVDMVIPQRDEARHVYMYAMRSGILQVALSF